MMLLITVSSSWPKNIAAHSRNAPTASAYWPADSTVNVYFVRGLFTDEQTKTLCETLAAWTEEGKKRNSAVKFVCAGQTGGLIDCLGCLTVSRQEVSVSKQKRASFNSLRHDEKGQVVSAWIAFDTAVTNTQALRDLMLEVLDRRPGSIR